MLSILSLKQGDGSNTVRFRDDLKYDSLEGMELCFEAIAVVALIKYLVLFLLELIPKLGHNLGCKLT